MPNIIRKIFLIHLPRLLLLNNINDEESNERRSRMGKRRRDALTMKKNNNSNEPKFHKINQRVLGTSVTNCRVRNALLMREAKSRNEYDSNNVLVIVEKESSPILTIKRHYKEIDCSITWRKRSNVGTYDNGNKQSRSKLAALNLKYVSEIADFMKSDYNMSMLTHEWKLLALVLDRLMFCIFCFAFVFGTFFIFLQSPTLYSVHDANGQPIDSQRLKNYCDLHD
jgi:hypothetical protein